MDQFQHHITAIYGKLGEKWLFDLPQLVEHASKKYSLSNLQPLENLTYHYVLSGFQRGLPIVLKLGLNVEEMAQEAKALKAFSEAGGVKLLHEDKGLLLLEHILPGTPLQSYFPLKDKDSTKIFFQIIQKMCHASMPQNSTFPFVQDWLKKLDKEWNIPSIFLDKARLTWKSLLATGSNIYLLHGDLHHGNILWESRTKKWVVIDPKGVNGEIYYEVASFIRNPLPELINHPDVGTIIENRINYLSSMLNLNPRRLCDWCFVQSVLAWIWALEDRIDEAPFRECAKVFDENFSTCY